MTRLDKMILAYKWQFRLIVIKNILSNYFQEIREYFADFISGLLGIILFLLLAPLSFLHTMFWRPFTALWLMTDKSYEKVFTSLNEKKEKDNDR